MESFSKTRVFSSLSPILSPKLIGDQVISPTPESNKIMN